MVGICHRLLFVLLGTLAFAQPSQGGDTIERFEVHKLQNLIEGTEFNIDLELSPAPLDNEQPFTFAFGRYSFVAPEDEFVVMEVLGDIFTQGTRLPALHRLSIDNAQILTERLFVVFCPAGECQFTFGLNEHYGDKREDLLKRPLRVRVRKRFAASHPPIPALNLDDVWLALKRKGIDFVTPKSAKLFLFSGQRINGIDDLNSALAFLDRGKGSRRDFVTPFGGARLEGQGHPQLADILVDGGRIPLPLYQALPKHIIALELPESQTPESISKAFFRSNGVSFWYYVVRLFGFALSAKVQDIQIDIFYHDIQCGFVAALRGSDKLDPVPIVEDHMCYASARATAEVPEIALSPLAFPSAKASVPAVAWRMGTVAEAFVKSSFPTGAKVTFVGAGDDTADMIITNIRNLVINGEDYWERLEISFVRFPAKNSSNIRVIADGAIARGLGDYPADSQFTTGMEPKYAKALNDFTSNLAVKLSAFITAMSHK